MTKKHHRPSLKTCPITYSVIVGILLLCLHVFIPSVSAQIMEGGQYKIELQEVLETEPTPTPVRKKAVSTLTPTPTPPPIQSYGQSEITVSDTFVQFGPLSPTNPVLRRLRFSITTPALPFALYQQMDHDLLSDPGNSIPPTSCDNGSCTEKQASLWTSTLTYGFGVRCENLRGMVCPDDFIEKNTFRPLGLPTQNTASVIASGISKETAEFGLTYKLVVPGTQAPGTYQATASYILIPEI